MGKILEIWRTDTTKIIYLSILIILGVFFVKKMFNPPTGHRYKFKMIMFTTEAEKRLKTTELGRHIFTSKIRNKLILPWEFNLWTQIDLFENAIVLKRHKKERPVFFYELYAIQPLSVNSLFVMGKYFGYAFTFRNKEEIILKSCDMYDLDIFINKLCSLFPPEKGDAIIVDIG